MNTHHGEGDDQPQKRKIRRLGVQHAHAGFTSSIAPVIGTLRNTSKEIEKESDIPQGGDFEDGHRQDDQYQGQAQSSSCAGSYALEVEISEGLCGAATALQAWILFRIILRFLAQVHVASEHSGAGSQSLLTLLRGSVHTSLSTRVTVLDGSGILSTNVYK